MEEGGGAARPDALYARFVFIRTDFSSRIELRLALEFYKRRIWACEEIFVP